MSETLVPIWLMHVAAMLSPGPNMLLVSRFAADQEKRSAQFAALGITLGAALWAISAVLGVQVLFEVFPALRQLFQAAGGFYLLYLAVCLWRSGTVKSPIAAKAQGPASAFRIGLLTNLTNPKSALFFSSVFAAASPASSGLAIQVGAVLMIVINVLCWHFFLAYAFSQNTVRAVHARTRRSINRLPSMMLGSFGGGLLFSLLREASAR